MSNYPDRGDGLALSLAIDVLAENNSLHVGTPDCALPYPTPDHENRRDVAARDTLER